MNITITNNVIGNEEVNSVSARDLHSNLEIKRQYADWIKDQIVRTRLINDRDYICISQKSEIGNKPRIEYILSLDSAKHIAMMSNTNKGFEIREYFIECEKQFRNQKPKELSRLEILEIALESEKKLIEANTVIEEQKPKVDYYNDLVDTNLLTNFRDSAKALGVKQNELINFLLDKKYIYRGADNILLPYSKYTPKWFVLKEWKNIFKSGVRTMLTVEGKRHFNSKINRDVL